MKSVQETINSSLRDISWNSMWEKTSSLVNHTSVWNLVDDSIWDQVGFSVRDSVRKNITL